MVGEFASGEKNSGTFAGFGGVEENEVSSSFSGSLFINERGIAFLFCLFARPGDQLIIGALLQSFEDLLVDWMTSGREEEVGALFVKTGDKRCCGPG